MTKTEEKISEQDLAELEQIGENLEAKTPAQDANEQPDKKAIALAKQAKLESLKQLRTLSPDLVKAEYFDAYRLMLKKGLSQSETAREAGVNRGAMLRAFKLIEQALPSPETSVERTQAEEAPKSKDKLSQNQRWIRYCAVEDVNWDGALKELTIQEIDELLQIEKRKTAVFKLKAQRKKLSKQAGQTTQPEAESFHVETPAPEAPVLVADDLETVPRERIQYLAYGQLDWKRWQPRTNPKVTPEFVAEIERAGGNTVPILVQERSIGQMAAVADGHRRGEAIRRINEGRKLEDHILIKCLIRPMTDEEAAFAAYSSNTGSEQLPPEDRDKWVYFMLSELKVPRDRIMTRFDLADTTLSNIIRAFEKTAKPIRELLDKGEISVGHAKAVASLPEVEQKRIASSIKQKIEKSPLDSFGRLVTPVSVRDVEEKAQKVKLKLDTRAKLTEYLKGLKSKTIKTKTEEEAERQIIRKVFPGGFNGSYVVQPHDVRHAMKEAEIELVLAKETEIEQDEPKKEKSIVCNSCLAAYPQHKLCLVGQKYGVTECSSFLPGARQWYDLPICGHCGGSTLHYKTGGLDDVILAHEWDDKLRENRVNHGFCALQAVIKKGRLAGLCENCSNPCGVSRQIHEREGLSLTVSKCLEYVPLERSIDELNKAALEYHDKLAREAQSKIEASKNGGSK